MFSWLSGSDVGKEGMYPSMGQAGQSGFVHEIVLRELTGETLVPALLAGQDKVREEWHQPNVCNSRIQIKE